MSFWNTYAVMQADAFRFALLIITLALALIWVIHTLVHMGNQDPDVALPPLAPVQTGERGYKNHYAEDMKAWESAISTYANIEAVLHSDPVPVPAWRPRLTKLVLTLAVACALAPSTKTLAVAFILPEIANSEQLREEAGEIYGIAKDALREAAGMAKVPEVTQ